MYLVVYHLAPAYMASFAIDLTILVTKEQIIWKNRLFLKTNNRQNRFIRNENQLFSTLAVSKPYYYYHLCSKDDKCP